MTDIELRPVDFTDAQYTELLRILEDHQPEENPGGPPLCNVCGDWWSVCPAYALPTR